MSLLKFLKFSSCRSVLNRIVFSVSHEQIETIKIWIGHSILNPLVFHIIVHLGTPGSNLLHFNTEIQLDSRDNHFVYKPYQFLRIFNLQIRVETNYVECLP